jgi:hypothetical protein
MGRRNDHLEPAFSIVHRGEGYRVGYCSPAHTMREAHVSRIYGVLEHKLYTVATHTYCKKDVSPEKYHWQASGLVQHWLIDEYLQELLDGLKKDSAERIARYPFELLEWVENGCEGLVEK